MSLSICNVFIVREWDTQKFYLFYLNPDPMILPQDFPKKKKKVLQ